MATVEALHRLAGVQDASDLGASSNERPSQPQIIPEPPPIPDDDTTNAHARASRASLPLNRQPSHKSFASSKNRSRSQSRVGDNNRHSHVPNLEDYPPTPLLPDQSQDVGSGGGARRASHDTTGSAATTGTEDFEWGPNHPCFPHPNPHCLPGSEEYKNTKVIRVRRDWLQSGDLYPQYANLYPEILDPMVSDADFRFLISNINARLKAAFDPYTTRAWVDSLMGALTGYLWDDVGLAGAKKDVKTMERFIDQWNRQREGEGKEVRLVQPRTTGFMSLDFVVPDPGIDATEGDADQDESA